ncbi:MAG: hypothetical protein H6719_08315 [Sandaracinaceae bacterium]|nr:hypothetical protein [Sandaracinaceae bacterium]
MSVSQPTAQASSGGRTVLLIVLGALGLGGVSVVCLVGGVFAMMESQRGTHTTSTYVPPPRTPEVASATATLSGRGDGVRARLEVRTAPGSIVVFRAGGSNPWPAEREVVADGAGLAAYEPDGVPVMPERRDEVTVLITVRHPEGRQLGRGRVSVPRPPGLTCRLSSTCECSGGAPACTIRFEGGDGVFVEGPAGSRVTVDGQTRALTGASVVIPIEPVAIDAAVTARIFGRADAVERAYPVSIDLPDGSSFSGELRKMSSGLRSFYLSQLREAPEGHPVPLPGEGRGHAIVLLDRGMTLYGEAESPADIRYVAEVTERTREAACGSYQDRRTGRTTRVVRHYTDGHVQLFDRRTGRRGASTTIRAPSRSCPTSVTRGGRLSSSYDEDEVDEWLERRAR